MPSLLKMLYIGRKYLFIISSVTHTFSCRRTILMMISLLVIIALHFSVWRPTCTTFYLLIYLLVTLFPTGTEMGKEYKKLHGSK